MPVTPIETPNFSIAWDERGLTNDPVPFQYTWTYMPHACGRVPPDFDLQIVCTAGGHYKANPGNDTSGYIENAGADFAAVEHCCPVVKDNNVYSTQATCQSVQCYTNDTTLASRWGDCYTEAAKVQMERVSREGNVTFKQSFVSARCEWIDYNELRKGLRKSGAGARYSGGARVSSILIGCVTITVMALLY